MDGERWRKEIPPPPPPISSLQILSILLKLLDFCTHVMQNFISAERQTLSLLRWIPLGNETVKSCLKVFLSLLFYFLFFIFSRMLRKVSRRASSLETFPCQLLSRVILIRVMTSSRYVSAVLLKKYYGKHSWRIQFSNLWVKRNFPFFFNPDFLLFDWNWSRKVLVGLIDFSIIFMSR